MKVDLTKEEVNFLITDLLRQKSDEYIQKARNDPNPIRDSVLDRLAKIKRTFKAPDGFILTEGKKYNWSGHSENYMTDVMWTDMKCKVVSISGDNIVIYDYSDNKDWEFNSESLRKICAKFSKRVI